VPPGKRLAGRAAQERQAPAYYAHARHGYVWGTEPVRYVSEIPIRYENYLKLVP
jgi:hypothetical protein